MFYKDSVNNNIFNLCPVISINTLYDLLNKDTRKPDLLFKYSQPVTVDC